MISMKCPNCGHGLKIRDKYAGKAGRCRKCRTKFTVPEPSAEPIALSTSDEYDQPSLSEIDRRLESGAFDQLIHEEKAQAAEGATGAPPYPNFSFLYWVTTVIVPPLGVTLASVRETAVFLPPAAS